MSDQNKFKMSRKVEKSLLWTFVLTLVIHGLFFSYKLAQSTQKSAFTPKKEKKIKIVLRQENNKKSRAKQIVTTEQTGRKEKPEDAKFLGKQDQSFDRQTSSKIVGKFKRAGQGIKSGSKTPQKAKKIVKRTQGKKKKSSRLASKRGPKRKKKISLTDLSLGAKKTKKVEEAVKQLAALGIENGEKGRVGLSQNNDYVEDVPLGDMTNLNTVEFKYYGFYHRIKQRLEQYWGDTLREKAEVLWKKGRRIPANENKITSLSITLDNFGNIVDILVKGTSGVSELDDAAIESFNKAGPFPNPPKGMMKNGTAKIEWGFVVKS